LDSISARIIVQSEYMSCGCTLATGAGSRPAHADNARPMATVKNSLERTATLPLAGVDDLENAIRNAKAWADAMMLLPDSQSYGNRKKIVELAAKYSLPAIYGDREFADDGGLIVYGPSIFHMWNRAAAYVDQILKGAKPADMPVEGPPQFDLIINTKTAESLGLKIPLALLATAEKTERQGEHPQRPW